MPGFEVLGKEERKAVNKVFDDGGILFAHGFKAQRKKYYVREFEKDLAKKFKCKFALPVSNGTSAIKIALKSLNVGSVVKLSMFFSYVYSEVKASGKAKTLIPKTPS